jgi:hypothetical protein
MTTYTLAIGADMLLATVPDGDDIHAAVQALIDENQIEAGTRYDVIPGCVLTDMEFDEEYYDYIWKSGNSGWLMDETGADWRYAVKP